MRDVRRNPIAVAVVLALANCGSDACADTVVVDSCGDPLFPLFETPLRSAIALAQNNDTVDLSGLSCSTITLEQGELLIEQNFLSLLGPYDHELTINAHGYSRAINHVGSGELYVSYLSATYGKPVGLTEYGGCIRSSGMLQIAHARLSHCSVNASGGAAYAQHLRVQYSTISGNSCYGSGGGLAAGAYMRLDHADVMGNSSGGGGGASVVGGGATFKAYDSTLRGNYAFSSGGGIRVAGATYVTRVTLSGNLAGQGIGGAIDTSALHVVDSTVEGNSSNFDGGFFAASIDIVGSTISGNSGSAAAVFGTSSVEIRNSTVVLNSSGGVYAYGTATIISSIVAKNTAGFDLYVYAGPGGLTTYTSLIASANVANVSLHGDPHLGPLADHGGGRRTHAVLPGSPVIDVGSNPLNLPYDERGLPRVVNAKPDIGAYERQALDDQLHYDGFESS